MSELTVFQNQEFGRLRTAEISDEVWFVGKDVAQALGYTNHRKALADHVDPEDKLQGDGVTIRDPIGREQHPTFINESGLYSLVLSSKLPMARKFKHWVTSEVLPSIHRTGSYQNAGTSAEENTQAAALTQLLAVVTTLVDTLLRTADWLEGRAVRTEPGLREVREDVREIVRMPEEMLKLEQFPESLRQSVDVMMEEMRESQTMNYSQIARYCTVQGYPISHMSVKKYFVKHFGA